MKKTVLLMVCACILFGLAAAVPLAAEESEFYYVNVPVLKVFPWRLGYYVIYRRAGLKTGEAYIPHQWFDRRDNRAILNLISENLNPYMTIMFRKGEFDHVRLVLPKDQKHPVWGVLSPGAPIEDKFQIEALTLEF